MIMNTTKINFCGRALTMGRASDPYGTECDRPAGHAGDHQGPHPLTDGRITWAGGGHVAGDPLPHKITSSLINNGTKE